MGLLLILMAAVCVGQNNARHISLGELVSADYLHEAISYYTDIKGDYLGMSEFRNRVQDYVDEVRSMGYDIPVYYNNAVNGNNNIAILNYRVWFNDLGYILPANHRELAELRTDSVSIKLMVDLSTLVDNYVGNFTDVSYNDSMLIDSMLRASAIGRINVRNVGSVVDSPATISNILYADTVQLSHYEASVQKGSVNVSPSSVSSTCIHELMIEEENREYNARQYYAKQVRQTMPLDELQFHRDTTWAQRGRLIAKGRFAYRMWLVHDAVPSHKLGRDGATLANGGSWMQSNLHTPGAKKLRLEAIGKYGRDIPFLGWDEQVYIDHYKHNTVFGDVRTGNAVAKKTSYHGGSSGLGKSKARRFWDKVQKFVRKPFACLKASRS